jgi:hypothetical protein
MLKTFAVLLLPLPLLLLLILLSPAHDVYITQTWQACEMFILEMTLRSWAHAEENRRRTLQRSDVAAAISRNEIFDFLVSAVDSQLINLQPLVYFSQLVNRVFMLLNWSAALRNCIVLWLSKCCL